ncbi:MAG: type II toxin-antitoxin system PemK/MazF family toxin [Candidatus Saccharimonadales bacterium]
MRRFEVHWVNLDPTFGSEMKKIRPCVVISPDQVNDGLRTVVVAPITKVRRDLGYRLDLDHDGVAGQIAFDQMRCVDKRRLVKPYGKLRDDDAENACRILVAFFAY